MIRKTKLNEIMDLKVFFLIFVPSKEHLLKLAASIFQFTKRVKYLPLFLHFLACSNMSSKPTLSPVIHQKTVAMDHHQNWKMQKFIEHDTWLAMNVDPLPTEQIKIQLSSISGKELKNRGEAHITLITPPEYEILKSHLLMNEINLIALKMDIQSSKWKPLCVGYGQHPQNSNSFVYFTIVDAPSLVEIRREVQRVFVQKGGNPLSFDPGHFYPHITIGFSESDIYEQDGLIKDQKTCLLDLATPEGQRITHWN